MIAKILILCIILSTFSIANSSVETIRDDIRNSKSIDELISKMNQADIKYRYLYMNAIKKQLSLLKTLDRKEKIESIINDLKDSSENISNNPSDISKTDNGFGGSTSSGGFGGNEAGGGHSGGGHGGGGGRR